RAIPVVGERLDDHGHAAGGVPLVRDLLVDDARFLAGPPFDRPLNRVDGYGVVARLLHHRAERGVGIGVTAAAAGGDFDLADEDREELAALRVGGTLLVLDRVPLRVPGHLTPSGIEE